MTHSWDFQLLFNNLLENAEFPLPTERKSTLASHVSQLVLELNGFEVAGPRSFFSNHLHLHKLVLWYCCDLSCSWLRLD